MALDGKMFLAKQKSHFLLRYEPEVEDKKITFYFARFLALASATPGNRELWVWGMNWLAM